MKPKLIGKILLLVVIIVTWLSVGSGHAMADAIVTVDGIKYDISTTTISNFSSADFPVVQATPWYGNINLSEALANALGSSLGGPAFVWAAFFFDPPGIEVDTFFFLPPGPAQLSEDVFAAGGTFYIAVGETVPTPEPGTPSLLFAGMLGLGLVVAVRRSRENRLATAV